MNNFLWLEQWYFDQSHTGPAERIQIQTLAPAGWHVRIDLRGTPYESLPNAILKRLADNDRDWMNCAILASAFEARGGPLMLGPIVQIFRNWIETVGL